MVIGAPLALLFAGGIGSAYWLAQKLVDQEPDLKKHERDTWKAVLLGFVGAVVLFTVAAGGL